MIGRFLKGGRGETCGTCGRTFASEADLMNHKQVFHGKDKEYDCRGCGMHFPSMESMRAHLQREHRYTGSRGSQHKEVGRRDTVQEP